MHLRIGTLHRQLWPTGHDDVPSHCHQKGAMPKLVGPCDTVFPTPRVEEPSRHGEKFALDKRDVSSPPFGRHGCCRAKGAKARRTFRLLLLRFGGTPGRERRFQRASNDHGLARDSKRTQPQVDASEPNKALPRSPQRLLPIMQSIAPLVARVATSEVTDRCAPSAAVTKGEISASTDSV